MSQHGKRLCPASRSEKRIQGRQSMMKTHWFGLLGWVAKFRLQTLPNSRMHGLHSRPQRICKNHDAQRVRLDCDREASHNLNRLLDKPGLDASFSYGNISLTFTVFRGRIYFIRPRSHLHRRHCSNDPIQNRIFRRALAIFGRFQASRAPPPTNTGGSFSALADAATWPSPALPHPVQNPVSAWLLT